MKRTKILIVVVLLFALLSTGYGQTILQARVRAYEPTTQTQPLTAEEAAPIEAQPLASAQSAPTAAAQPGEAVEPRTVQTDMFRAKFEGDRVSGSGEAVDGVYRFRADKTDGEAWHVKLECNYPTVAGRDYYVTYRFVSDVAGTIKFGDFQEFKIQKGENTVTGIMIASSGTSYLDLQLGKLAPFTIDFTEIEVEEFADVVDYEDALSAPVNFERESRVYERHDQGYAPILTRTADDVSIYYFSAPWDPGVWKSRLYVNTGLIPEMGERYRLTVDVECDADMPYELLFNDGEREKGYGALYGQQLVAGEVNHCEAVITGGEGDELVLQFSLGQAPEDATVHISSLRLEKVKDHYTSELPAHYALNQAIKTGKILTSMVPETYTPVSLGSFSFEGTDSVREEHMDGYVVELEESGSSATLKILQAPANAGERGVWKVKLFAATGVALQGGNSYCVKYDLAATGAQAKYEALFNGDTEKAYDGLYDRSLTAGGTDHVEYTVTPAESKGPLTLCLQLGLTDSAAGNTYTLSNVEVIDLGTENVSEKTLPDPFYPNVGEASTDGKSFFVEANNANCGSAATLTGDGSSATVTVTAPGQADWHTKLYALTGVAVTAGESYVLSMDVSGTSGWSAVYKAGGDEKALPDPSVSGSTYTWSFSPEGSGNLEVILKLGTLAADSSVTVSNVQLKKVGGGYTQVTLTGFAYPETTTVGGSTVAAHYEAQTATLSASAVAWDGSEANAYMDNGAAKLNITKARNDGQGGMWSTRLEVNTGVTLEKGEKYFVSGTLSSQKALDFEVLYSNGVGTDENESYNPSGQGYAEGSWGLSVGDNGSTQFSKEFTVPERTEYKPLYLRIQVGNGAADNAITVSNITVSKWIPEHTEGGSTQTDRKSFFFEPNAGNAGTDAVLTGDGSSATVTVITPGADWNVKLYAQPHYTVESGKQYKVSMDVSGASGWKAVYKIVGSGDEQDFGEGMTFTAGGTGELEVILKLGEIGANNSVTVSNFKLEQYSASGETDVLPSTFAYPVTSTGVNANKFELETSNGAEATMTGDGSSATVTVTTPHDDWHVKLYGKTDISLEAGHTYRITAKVRDVNGGGWGICYKREGGEEYDFTGALSFGDTVVNTVTPTQSGKLEVMLKLGAIPAGGVVTLSDIKVEEISYSKNESILPSFHYDSVGFVSKAADNGYITSLSQSGNTATLDISQAPAERHPWNVKLNVRTGFTPEKNKGYCVSVDVEAQKHQNVFEIFYDGASEQAYGALTSEPASTGKRTYSYIIMPGESKGELSLQLRFGQTNGSDGNRYTVSNLRISEVGFRYTESPEIKAVAALDTQPGYSERLEKTRDKLTLRVDKTPKTGMEPWKSKLFIQTGTTLKAGEKYRVSMVVKSIIPAPFEVCFNHGDVEKGLGGMFGLLSSPSGYLVEYVTFPNEDIDLVLQLSLGNCASPNTLMVSNVKVEKAAETFQVSDTIYTF